MLAYIYWNPDPVAFSLGPLQIRWYGLLFALPFVIGYFLMQHFYKRENQPVKYLDTLLTYVILGAIIGARLGHCLFYEPEIYLRDPIRILKIWEGGLASHGGAIGVIIALWLYSRKTHQSFWWTTDRVAILVGMAGACIRFGNVMNSEIIGKPTNLPWGFIFARVDDIPRHPAQLYESLAYLLIFVLMLYLYYRYLNRKITIPEGYFVGLLLILVFSVRFFIEFLKEPQVGFEQNLALNMGQLLSIPFIIFGLWLMVRKHKIPTQKKQTS